ncbi:hypothetical protein [Chlorogloeopsis sp. ULAP02]|uniref:hypothetical protein n=1 Tax=Chlorogloeopsis sp. ULAP02 TaxID=3107926 RepID=UPI003136988C
MSDCPCCNRKLLQHIRSSGVYWFCPDCRQEMPDMSSIVHAKRLSSAMLSAKIGRNLR